MINQIADVDRLLQALADPTRRRIIEQLSVGPASVTALAAPLPMSLPAVVQHLQVLEGCGLVTSQKVGRVRTCRLDVNRLETVQELDRRTSRHMGAPPRQAGRRPVGRPRGGRRTGNE